MDLLEAHARLALRADRGEDVGIDYDAAEAKYIPLVAAGFANASGWLDDAVGDEQLIEAVKHGRSLFEAEVISVRDVNNAAAELLAALQEVFAK
jgi:hypothetical protein